MDRNIMKVKDVMIWIKGVWDNVEEKIFVDFFLSSE